MRRMVLALAAVATLTAAADLHAVRGSEPIAFTRATLPLERIAHQRMPAVDVASLVAEDAAGALKPGIPRRVALEVPLDLPMTGATVEELDGGDRLWRLRVSSEGAVFLSFLLTDFELVEGAEMRFYSVDRDYHDGPYTHATTRALQVFRSPLVPGDSAVLEIFVPAGMGWQPGFTVAAVSHGYRDFRGVSRVPFRDGRRAPRPLRSAAAAIGATCEVDVNCPEGADWQDDKRAVAETFDGTFVCTGAMLNNVRQDCRNFFLTANHCTKSKGKAAGLVFFWNYENSGCNTGDATFDQTTVGSTFLAGNAQSDFTLLELTQAPPPEFFVFHSGWNRSPDPPTSAVTIHHPNDLPKKISFEFDPLVDGGRDGWGPDHWRVTGWDIGTTEPGSSGSGLWNPAHQVIGQLHGGIADCSGGWDEYGKLSVSWGNGMSEWLDPDGTGAISVDGLDCNDTAPPPPEPCTLGAVGDPCTSDAECCSNTCRGKPGAKVCK